jgi:hypothetical protein
MDDAIDHGNVPRAHRLQPFGSRISLCPRTAEPVPCPLRAWESSVVILSNRLEAPIYLQRK